MTSTIKVDNIQNQNGETFNLVSWDTGSIKTATFTAVSGQGFFCNTTAGAFTCNLPSSPSAGDIVAVSDYAQTAATNNITIGRNGSNIQGDASDLVITRNGVAMTLVYVDATKGWVATNTGAEADKEADPEFITATGGTITTCGNYKIHTFTGPGTFTVCSVGNPLGSTTVSYMVVAGGGGAGANSCASSISGGGGGAGGYREGKASSDCYTASPLNAPAGLPVSIQAYPVSVGGGGSGGPPSLPKNGVAGSNSIFSTITSAGGGFGMGRSNPSIGGGPGGSGGGTTGNVPGTGGTGNTPPVSPPQGNNGGNNNTPPASNISGIYGSAGGGGAGAAANPVDTPPAYGATAGGNGVTSCITASPVTRAGGGGGGGANSAASPLTTTDAGGSGGSGGGGAGGSSVNAVQGANGTANTGGGGGSPGAGIISATLRSGGAGGSGIVVIRYKFQ